jgi:hypothetical protein
MRCETVPERGAGVGEAQWDCEQTDYGSWAEQATFHFLVFQADWFLHATDVFRIHGSGREPEKCRHPTIAAQASFVQ